MSVSSANSHKISKQNEVIKIISIKELDAQLAKNKGKKIILDFTAKWCSACKELEAVTFSNTNVIKQMNKYVVIKADITDNTQAQKELSAKYGISGPPAILFIDKNSKVEKSKTIIGFVEPDILMKYLN